MPHSCKWLAVAIAVFVALVGAPNRAAGQSADNVLVVINNASPDSVRVGEYYVQKRSVAKDHVVYLRTATSETIARQEYERSIETPIGFALQKGKLQDRILYIVLTKGVPLRITGTEGPEGITASVDSELTLLYAKNLGFRYTLTGKVPNPYYLGDGLLASAKRFTRIDSELYLVTRLDGFTVQDVIGLIDRGSAPSRDGKIVLDQKSTLMDAGGDKWLADAADRLKRINQADRVVLEETRATASVSGPVLGYYSWGSNDSSNRLRRFGLSFANGAIAAMFVSSDGRTFVEPPATWKPGDTGQSLAGDLIRDGVTGIAAHVSEPYLDATIRPQILFPLYLQGFNLAEAFYTAMPYLSWQTIVIGDPLCAPFQQTALSPEQIHKGIDPTTEWPALYSERRLALLAKGGLKVEALKLMMKVDARTSEGTNFSVIEPLLVQATELEPRLTAGHVQLAVFYSAAGMHAKAIERYRKALAQEPKNVVVLNDLAYALAIRANAPQEALPLAQQAYDLAPGPAVSDTLGWIKHLLGDDQAATPLLERALSGAPTNTEILIHLAAVHAATGNVAKARADLDAAAKVDPKIETRDDVKALRQRLAAKP